MIILIVIDTLKSINLKIKLPLLFIMVTTILLYFFIRCL